jgi:hypothetical protein
MANGESLNVLVGTTLSSPARLALQRRPQRHQAEAEFNVDRRKRRSV